MTFLDVFVLNLPYNSNNTGTREIRLSRNQKFPVPLSGYDSQYENFPDNPSCNWIIYKENVNIPQQKYTIYRQYPAGEDFPRKLTLSEI